MYVSMVSRLRWGAALWVIAAIGRPGAVRAEEPRSAVYVEVLGKGGLWGLGVDHQHGRWLGGGLAGSFYVLDDQRVMALSPYLAAHPLGRGRHRWFVHTGPQLVRVSTPSPVPEWNGVASTGLGAQLSTGYEYRHRVLFRLSAMVVVGEGGVAPWLGASLGWTL
jgi:hypothetical protein